MEKELKKPAVGGKKRKLNRLLPADYVFILILVILSVSVVLPFLNVIAISFSTDMEVGSKPYMIFPTSFHFDSYKVLLSSSGIWRSIGLTVIYVVGYVALNIITSLLAGFAISGNVPGKGFMLTYLLIPTLFSGGLVPTYLVITSLGLVDNVLLFFIIGCVSCFDILLVKTYIRGLPYSVTEAAYLDGANYLQLLFYVIAPMCVPILATIGTLAAISKWNDWWLGYMYIKDKTYLWPIQNVIRKLSLEKDPVSMRELGINVSLFTESFQMASIMVVTLPIMCIYPFIQKYFEQGLNVGSVKD